MVAGAVTHLERRIEELPLDVATVRHAGDGLDAIRRRVDAWLRISGRGRDEQSEWAAEVAWRIARLYEQRFVQEAEAGVPQTRSTSQRLR